jgi:hypothetical protein
VLDRLDSHAGVVAMPLMIAGPLAWIVLAGAAARAGIAPRWIVVGMVAFAFVDNFPIPAAEEVQGLIGLATFGAIALRLLRLRDADWELATRPSSGVSARTTNVAAPARA